MAPHPGSLRQTPPSSHGVPRSTNPSDPGCHDAPAARPPSAVDVIVAIACVVAIGHLTNRVVTSIAIAWLAWLVVLRVVEYLVCIVLGR